MCEKKALKEKMAVSDLDGSCCECRREGGRKLCMDLLLLLLLMKLLLPETSCSHLLLLLQVMLLHVLQPSLVGIRCVQQVL